jgi:hypothetical protein
MYGGGFDPQEAYDYGYGEQEAGEASAYYGGGFDPQEAYDYGYGEQEAGEGWGGFDPQEVYDYGYSNLCSKNSDCQSGELCLDGICTPRGEAIVIIRGVLDSRTCSYCRSQIGRTGSFDSMNLPPFHEHCRCSWSFI